MWAGDVQAGSTAAPIAIATMGHPRMFSAWHGGAAPRVTIGWRCPAQLYSVAVLVVFASAAGARRGADAVCGTGPSAEFPRQRGHQVVGVDGC